MQNFWTNGDAERQVVKNLVINEKAEKCVKAVLK